MALNWTDPAIRSHDNWRNELADAGDFDTVQATRLLITPQAAWQIICHDPISWLVTANNAQAEAGLPASARLFAQNRETSLWRIATASGADDRVSHCAQTPTND